MSYSAEEFRSGMRHNRGPIADCRCLSCEGRRIAARVVEEGLLEATVEDLLTPKPGRTLKPNKAIAAAIRLALTEEKT